MVKKNVLVHRAGVVVVGETSGFVDSAAQQWHQKPRSSLSPSSCPQGSASPPHSGRVTASSIWGYPPAHSHW